jgi:DNA-binding LacI/PurR family transcriptional regulator
LAREKKFKVGKDIGIISYNESPINEIILNGLTSVSTDFCQMGESVAEMILNRKLAKIKCDFHMIRRGTF